MIAVEMSAAGKPVFITANNKAEGCAPLTVFRLAGEIARRAGGGVDAG
jgi:hypothetical protein